MPDRFSNKQKTAHFIEGFAYAKEAGVKPQSIQRLDSYMFNLKQMSENPDLGQEMSEQISQYYQDLMAYYDLCRKAGMVYGTGADKQFEEDFKAASEKADTITEHINKLGFINDPDQVGKMSQKLQGNANICSLYGDMWTKDTVFGGEKVLNSIGPKKSAAKWIEDYRKEIKKGQPVSEDTVAKILASRQLANAVLGVRKNIDNTQLTQAEIDAQAYKLKNSDEFKEYVKQNQPFNAELLKDGHGGKFEKTFEDFLVKTKPEKELDFDAHGRYRKRIDDNIKANADFEVLENPYKKKEAPRKEPEWAPGKEGSPKYPYKTYGEYFEKNKANLDGTVSPEYHAAKMAAADALKRKDPHAAFSDKDLKNKAREFMKDPAFKIVTKIPGNVEMINRGDAEGFAKEVRDLELSCDAMLNEKGKFEPEGYDAPSLDRLEEAAENDPELKVIVDKYNDLSAGEGHSSKEIIDVMNAITDYQDKYAHVNTGTKAKNVNDTLRLLSEMTEGRSVGSIVNTQIDKINKSRGIENGDHRYLTRDMIRQEGKEEANKAIDRIMNGSRDSIKPDEAPEEEVPEELNKAFNLGHKSGNGPMFNI